MMIKDRDIPRNRHRIIASLEYRYRLFLNCEIVDFWGPKLGEVKLLPCFFKVTRFKYWLMASEFAAIEPLVSNVSS